MRFDLVPLGTASSLDDWLEHLRHCGLHTLHGLPVDFAAVAVPDAVVDGACRAFLESVDAVLASASANPAHATPDAIALALTAHHRAVSACVGVVLYLGPRDGVELLGELVGEMASARDALATLHARHWSPHTFYTAVASTEPEFSCVRMGFVRDLDALSWRHDVRAET